MRLRDAIELQISPERAVAAEVGGWARVLRVP
jgi:hypothetical protein